MAVDGQQRRVVGLAAFPDGIVPQAVGVDQRIELLPGFVIGDGIVDVVVAEQTVGGEVAAPFGRK